jgi:hypothetical protein
MCRRIQNTRRAGNMPTPNRRRHAIGVAALVYAGLYAVLPANHFAHQHRTGRPLAAEAEPGQISRSRRRFCADRCGHWSGCNARNTNSCSKFWAKPQRKVKTEYHAIAICMTRTRPKRSARAPAIHPPSEEVSNVTVPIVPAVPADMPHRRLVRPMKSANSASVHTRAGTGSLPASTRAPQRAGMTISRPVATLFRLTAAV